MLQQCGFEDAPNNSLTLPAGHSLERITAISHQLGPACIAHSNMCRLLDPRKGQIEMPTQRFRAPAIVECAASLSMSEKLATVQLLLHLSADPNAKDSVGRSCIYVAARGVPELAVAALCKSY